MFSKKKKETLPVMLDLDGKPLKEGDIVESLRYDLGKCRIIKTGEMYAYESLESGEKVSWARMIDAASKKQKVRKSTQNL
ncbi:MAG: hypothetical protein HQ565_13055 [Bacteroidetes bacterium]|nr:hypothetical protein [Bacteroidota bacterium]